MPQELYPYQAEGIERLFSILTGRKEHAAMLCDPPGAGKTPQAVGVFHRLTAQSALVLCPASLKENWKREFIKWSTGSSGSIEPSEIQILESSSEAIREDARIIILSYQLALRVSEKLSEKGSFDLLILDESHVCKSASSQVSRIALVVLWAKCRYRLMMTGTPLPNGRAVEAYTTFSRCSKEHFGSWETFKDRYCIEQRSRWGSTYPGSKNLSELKEISKDFMVRRPKEEVLQSLPGLVRQNVYLTLPRNEVFSIEQGIDVDAILEAVENGWPLDSDHIATARKKLAILKAPLVIEAIEETLEEVDNVVVFVHHRELYDRVMENFSSIVGINGLTPPEERTYAVDRFQSGEVKVFLASLKAANTGLTLTKASTLIMAEYDWVPSTNEQAEGRIYRISQNEICRVKYLVGSESLDERVLSVVQRKQREIVKAIS